MFEFQNKTFANYIYLCQKRTLWFTGSFECRDVMVTLDKSNSSEKGSKMFKLTINQYKSLLNYNGPIITYIL